MKMSVDEMREIHSRARCADVRVSHFWVGRVEHDAAGAGAVAVDGHLHVAGLAPGRPPRVLHEPVFLARLRLTVADEQDGVVKRSAAFGVKHARFVRLERELVRLDGDGDWPAGQRFFEGSDALRRN